MSNYSNYRPTFAFSDATDINFDKYTSSDPVIHIISLMTVYQLDDKSVAVSSSLLPIEIISQTK